jgi:thiosulfate reductase cytochrome b subunit
VPFPSRFRILIWLIPAIIAALVAIVLVARGIRDSGAGHDFLAAYPGRSALPSFAPVGFPAWLAWQHGLNAFLMLFVLRTGWQVRTTSRPDTFWTRNNTGLITTKGAPVRLTLTVWFHIAIDVVWLLNGVVFYILLFTTRQWTRMVPVHWDIFPNALSAILQYASLDWPTENGWSNYNSVQTLAYFGIVFLAAPVALATGIRMAPGFAARFRPLDRVFPVARARLVHFVTMVVFAVFIVVHVTLVLATGARNNLNHLYATNNGTGWGGFVVFAASLALMAIAWILARPAVLRAIAGTMGEVRQRPQRPSR